MALFKNKEGFEHTQHYSPTARDSLESTDDEKVPLTVVLRK
jgi:hypothetical protein